MTSLCDAAQQALEAMHSFEWSKNGLYAGEFETEIAALRKALAEQDPDSKHATIAEWWADKQCPNCASLQDQNTELDRKLAELRLQEPVAWMVYTLDGKSVCVTDNPSDFTEQHKALPLYTAPPQRKPLSDDEIQELSRQHKFDSRMGKFVRIIEAAHGIKDA